MIASLITFAKKDLLQKKVYFWIGVLSIALGTAFALVFLAVIGSMYRISEEKTATLKQNEIRVMPLYRVGFLNVTKTEQKKIDDMTVASIKALPEVEDISRETIAQFPTSLEVNVFNASFETDSPVYGIEDKEFLQKRTYTQQNDLESVLFSSDLLDIYNIGIAQAIGKPQLNEQFLVGLPFTLKLGYSSFFKDHTSDKQQIKSAQIVGVADGLSIVGLTLPISRVLELNKAYLGKEYSPVYSRLTVTVKPGAQYQQVKQKITAMGYDVTSFEDQLAPVKSQLSFVSALLLSIVAVVFVFIILHFFFLFYSQLEAKHYMISLLRIFGARERDVLLLFIIQMSYIALTGIVIGLVIGGLFLLVANYLLIREFPFIIDLIGTPLTLNWQDPLYLALVLYGVVLGAILYPAWRGTKLLPRDILANS